MSLSSQIRHYFAPHKGNNFRARLLHNSGIFLVIGMLLTGNLAIRILEATPLHILGFSSSITISETVAATNAERLKNGLPALNYSETLADAARRKAANMLEENYWAHNSPSGKNPWTWFKSAGYNYLYAGENLAKDFGSTDRMISAWMASPTHRDNIVNPKYSEIGLAVVPGTLQGKETVLVVQLFAAPSNGTVTTGASNQVSQQPVPTAAPTVAQVQVVPDPTVVPVVTPVDPAPEIRSATKESSQAIVAEVETKPLINDFTVKKFLSLATTLLFLLALVIDLIIAESSVLSRRVGKNWAHIIFINIILLATTIVNAGSIL